jgi:hypothetical protein
MTVRPVSKVPVAGSAGRSITVRVGGGPATVLSAGSRLGAASMPVDVVIVFDTTGSMDTKINGLVACAVAMVSALAQSGLDWRLTAVPFGDLMVVGDTIETELPWCSDPVSAERSLRTMRRNAGGGNAGESSFEALLAGVRKPGREGALRVVLLVTDEPPHTHTIKPAAMVDQLRQRDVLCNVISPDLAAFRSLAQATGGTWLQIAASVDMRSLIAAWSRLGGQIADRAEAVVRLGGSPQRALALEAGR